MDTARLADRAAIDDLMNGWLFRDTLQWEELGNLFHPDATIEITWFEGLARDFIAGSERMGASDLRTKHLIGGPVITFNGDRAVAETSAMIVAENVARELATITHNRFLDQLEMRDGQWRISRRQSLYDMSSFTSTGVDVEVDLPSLRRHPRAYAPLAYVLERSGFPVEGTFPTRGDEREAAIREEGRAWLAGAATSPEEGR